MATSARIKACGGRGPYTWSKTGNIELSSNTGTAITIRAPSGSVGNLFPNDVAFLGPPKMTFQEYAEDAPCGGDHFTRLKLTTAATCAYNCAGAQLSPPCSQTSALPSFSATGSATCSDGPLNYTSNLSNINYSSEGPKNESNISLTISYTNPNSGAAYSSNLSHGLEAFPGVVLDFGGLIDLRTAAMVNSGDCFGPCQSPSGATVTVTDSVGVSVTFVVP